MPVALEKDDWTGQVNGPVQVNRIITKHDVRQQIVTRSKNATVAAAQSAVASLIPANKDPTLRHFAASKPPCVPYNTVQAVKNRRTAAKKPKGL